MSGAFPQVRLRRLRRSAGLRAMVAETRLSAQQLVLPLFVRPGRKVRMAVQAMPGVFQLSPEESLRDAELAFKIGVPAVLLFGIPECNTAGTPILNDSPASLRDSRSEEHTSELESQSNFVCHLLG